MKGPKEVKSCNDCEYLNKEWPGEYIMCYCDHPEINHKYIQDYRYCVIKTRDWCPYV